MFSAIIIRLGLSYFPRPACSTGPPPPGILFTISIVTPSLLLVAREIFSLVRSLTFAPEAGRFQERIIQLVVLTAMLMASRIRLIIVRVRQIAIRQMRTLII